MVRVVDYMFDYMLKYVDDELKPVDFPKEGIPSRPVEVVIDALIARGTKDLNMGILMHKRADISGNNENGIIEYIFRVERGTNIKPLEDCIQKYFTECGLGEFSLIRCGGEGIDYSFEYSWSIDDGDVPQLEDKIVLTAIEKKYVRPTKLNLGYNNYNDWYCKDKGMYSVIRGIVRVLEE